MSNNEADRLAEQITVVLYRFAPNGEFRDVAPLVEQLAALAKQQAHEATAEPVAEVRYTSLGTVVYVQALIPDIELKKLPAGTKLYTGPQKVDATQAAAGGEIGDVNLNESVEYEVVQDGCVQATSLTLSGAQAIAEGEGPWAMSIYKTHRTLVSSNGKLITPPSPAQSPELDAVRSFWQRHTQSNVDRMSLDDLHADVEQQAPEATAERKTHCDACNTPGARMDAGYTYCPTARATAEPAGLIAAGQAATISKTETVGSMHQEVGAYEGLSDERIERCWPTAFSMPSSMRPKLIKFARAVLAEAGIKEKP